MNPSFISYYAIIIHANFLISLAKLYIIRLRNYDFSQMASLSETHTFTARHTIKSIKTDPFQISKGVFLPAVGVWPAYITWNRTVVIENSFSLLCTVQPVACLWLCVGSNLELQTIPVIFMIFCLLGVLCRSAKIKHYIHLFGDLTRDVTRGLFLQGETASDIRASTYNYVHQKLHPIETYRYQCFYLCSILS